jgi:uncharacterized lipoprotein YajG
MFKKFSYIYRYKKNKKKIMKKIVLLLSIVALASCGSGPSTEVKSDSTAVAIDSTKVLDSTSVDSTAVEQVEAVETK